MLFLLKVSVVKADILRVRIPNESVVEHVFEVEGSIFRFYDVAGQKDKRQRWVPYFSSKLSALIYIVSVASYDRVLDEDKSVNRYIDSLVLFESIMQHPLLSGISTIVLLNKIDLFYIKCKTVSFKDFIHQYSSTNSPEDIIKFIAQDFVKKNREKERQLVVHVTTATDIKLMKGVIRKIQLFHIIQEVRI